MSREEDVLFSKTALELGLIKTEQLAYCLRIQYEEPDEEKRTKLSELLVQKGLLSQSQVLNVYKQMAHYLSPGLQEECKKIGRYQVLQELGRGGMGVVYKVYDPLLGRAVALKMLLHGQAPQEDGIDVARFLREAKATARLRHPNIVSLYDIGEENDAHFFTMDIVEGGSLAEAAKRSLTIRQAIQIMIKVGNAIHYAHSEGIIHRDLKPANIMLTKDGEPKVMDFGLAKFKQESKKLSQSGMIIGTVAYMPPEQIVGSHQDVDERSDVYALGAILYELLTGSLPIPGNNFEEFVYKVLYSDPLPPTQIKPHLPRGIERVCLKSLEKNKDWRYQNAMEFVDDLLRFSRGEKTRAQAVQVSIEVRRLVKHHRKTAIVIGLLVLAVVVALAGTVVWHSISARHELQSLLANKQKILAHVPRAVELSKKFSLADKAGQTLEPHVLSAVEDSLQKCMEARAYLEQARILAPGHDQIKRDFFQLDQEAASLALLMNNYFLAELFFTHCLTLGYEKEFLASMSQLKSRKTEIARLQIKRVEEIMHIVEKGELQEGMLAEYVTEMTRMQSHYVIPVLIGFLESQHEWQRRICIETLGKLGDARTKVHGRDAVEWLLARLAKLSLKDNQPEIEDIIWALGRLKDPRANGQVNQLRWNAPENHLFLKKTALPFSWIPVGEDTAKPVNEANVKDATRRQIEEIVGRGVMKVAKGDLAGAIADYDRALELAPNEPVAYVNRGLAYAAQKKFERAIVDYDRAIALNPKDPKAYINRGVAFREMQQPQKALEEYRQAIALAPKQSLAYLNRSAIYLDSGELEKAIADCNQALLLDPSLALAYGHRGTAYQLLGKLSLSLADLSKAIELNPEDGDHYVNRAVTWRKLGDIQAAIADYDSATHRKPRQIAIYINRAGLYIAQRDWARAINDCNKALEIDSRSPMAYYNRGNAYLGQNDFDAALADFDRAIQLNPSYEDAYMGRGNLHKLRKNQTAAIADYEKLAGLNPAKGYVALGNLCAENKDWQVAKSHYDHAIALAPNDSLGYRNRGVMCSKMRNWKGAIADYSKAIELSPQEAAIYRFRGFAYVEIKNLPLAVQDFRQAIELRPEEPEAYQHCMIALLNMQKYSEIKPLLQVYLRKWPNDPDAMQMQKILKEKLGS